MFKKLSINKQILIPTIAALICSYAIIIIISINSSNEVRSNTIEQTKATVESTAQSVTNYFANFEKGMQLLANNEHLQEASRASIADGQLHVEQLFQMLMPYNAHYEGVLSTYIGLANGQTVISPNNDVPEGYDPRERDWYKSAVEKKGAAWSAPYVDAFTGELVVTVSIPMYHNDAVMAVVSTDISLTNLISKMNELNPGYGGHIALISEDGQAIVHKTLQNENVFEHEAYAFLQSMNLNDFTVKEQEMGDQLFVYEPLETISWTVGAIYEQQRINEVAKSTLMTIFITAVIVMITISVLIAWIVRKIMKPVQHLEQTAHQVAAGDLTVTFTKRSDDEVGNLVDAFSNMVSTTDAILHKAQQTAMQLHHESSNLATYAEKMQLTSGQIVDASNSITEEAIHVSERASEANESTEHVTAKMQRIQENTNVLAQSTEETANVIEQGLAQIEQLNDTSVSVQQQMEQAIYNIHIELDKTVEETALLQEKMNNMVTASQQTVAATEEVTASTEEQRHATSIVAESAETLLQTAEELKQTVNQFKLKGELV